MGFSEHLHRFKTLRGRILLLSVLLIAILTIFGPMFAGLIVQKIIDRSGIETLTVESFKMNPFNQTIEVSGDQSSRSQSNPFTLDLQLNIRDLFSHTVGFRTIHLKGGIVEFKKTESGWSLLLPEFYHASEPSEPLIEGTPTDPWLWEIDTLKAEGVKLRFASSPPAEIILSNITFKRINPGDPKAPISIAIKGTVASGLFHITGNISPFDDNLSGSVQLSITDLRPEQLLSLIHAQPGFDLSGTIACDLNISLFGTITSPQIIIEGNIAMQQGMFTDADTQIKASNIRWQGEIEHASSRIVVHQSSINISELITVGDSFHLALKKISGEGIGLAQDTLQIRQLQLSELAATLPSSPEPLNIDDISITDIFATKEQINSAIVTIRDITLPTLTTPEWGIDPGGEIELLRGEQLHISKKSVRIESLDLQGLITAVERIHSQPTGLPEEQKNDESTIDEQSAKEPSSPDTEQWSWSVGNLHLFNSNRVLVQDFTIQPSTHFLINLEDLQLSGYDSNDNSSANHDQMNFNGKGTINRFAKIAVNFNGSSDLSSGQGEVKLEELNLLDISPYLRSQLGQRVKSGHLQLVVTGKTKGTQLTGNLDLHLKRFELEATKDKNGETGSNLPLRSALRLLRNRQGDIDISIPVSGDRSSPDFAVHKVVIQAISNGAKAGVISYYAPIGVSLLTGTALPIGAISALSKVNDWITSYRFNNVSFVAGSSTIEAEQSTYLDTVATLLQKKSSSRLLICGYATETEMEGILDIPSRISLAENRSLTVKRYLAEKEIDTDRLFLCEPMIDPEVNGIPRVELLL